MHVLFIAPYISSPPFRNLSIALILETGQGGHYVAYQRDPLSPPKSPHWRFCDDTKVINVDAARVLEAEGYILFYRQQVSNPLVDMKVAAAVREEEMMLRLKLDADRIALEALEAAAAAAAANLETARALRRKLKADKITADKQAAAARAAAAAAADVVANERAAAQRELGERTAAAAAAAAAASAAAAGREATQREATQTTQRVLSIAHDSNISIGINTIPITAHFLTLILSQCRPKKSGLLLPNASLI